MASKNGLAELAKRVPPNQLLKFKDFQAKHAEYQARVNKLPEKLPNIDWDYYKRNVRADFVKMVDEFQQKYKSVCEAYDKRAQQDKSQYFVEIDKLKEQVKAEVEKYKAESNERIKALEAKYSSLEALIPYEQMTIEEYTDLLPEKSLYRYNGQPSFWPHTPEEQGPGPALKDGDEEPTGGGKKGDSNGDDDPKGSGSASNGGGAAAAPKTKAAQPAKKTESQPEKPATEPSAKSVASTESCFESEQFKRDLENLKNCFEENSPPTKNVTKDPKIETANNKNNEKPLITGKIEPFSFLGSINSNSLTTTSENQFPELTTENMLNVVGKASATIPPQLKAKNESQAKLPNLVETLKEVTGESELKFEPTEAINDFLKSLGELKIKSVWTDEEPVQSNVVKVETAKSDLVNLKPTGSAAKSVFVDEETKGQQTVEDETAKSQLKTPEPSAAIAISKSITVKVVDTKLMPNWESNDDKHTKEIAKPSALLPITTEIIAPKELMKPTETVKNITDLVKPEVTTSKNNVPSDNSKDDKDNKAKPLMKEELAKKS